VRKYLLLLLLLLLLLVLVLFFQLIKADQKIPGRNILKSKSCMCTSGA